ncbi:SGNH/GDSL hydrolase family protein [bacterium]|nr:SGNH/GDSL hydrolase family protein [bacterium]
MKIDRRSFIRCGAVTAMSTAFCTRVRASDSIPTEIDGYHYKLPKFAKGSRLLFQGDSITDMKWGRNQKDRNHYLGHSYVYLIAARLGVDMPEAQLDIYNRGMSGHTVGDLRKRWQKDAIDMKPDLLSILIGTNDVGREVQPDAFESDYRSILDASRKAKPNLRMVLLDPFVLRSGRLKEKKVWKARRNATDELRVIVDRIAKDYDAVHVKTQDIFDAATEAASPEHWIWDGIHPLPQGHELIARNWLDEVSARWGDDSKDKER